MTPPLSDRITARDLDAYWMPFTANRHFKASPRILVAAEGMYYTRDDGMRVLDGTSGLWCVNAGHGREEIIEAIEAQARRMDYAPAYHMGHPGAFALAAKLASMLPADLDHIFFTNSGSEAVDTALKIAIATHRIRGQDRRTRLVGRELGFHGAGFGGISVGGIPAYREGFGGLLCGVDHLPHTHHPEHNAFSRGLPEWGVHLADELEAIVARHGAQTIAAVIVEPVAGSAGALLPPKGYLQRLREICDRHGIFLVFDEVITAFGRLGGAFACEVFGVLPDIVTMAKGLTNGTVPMGAVAVRKEIYETFMSMEAPEIAIELHHGYTYSGHPVACAAALATLDIYGEGNLFARARELAPVWEDAVHALKGLPHVTDIRNLGLIAGIELEPIPERPAERAFGVYLRCFEKGILIRTTGDVIALSPPLIIEKDEIDRLTATLAGVLEESA